MKTKGILLSALLLVDAASGRGQDAGEILERSRELMAAGDYDGAIALLEPHIGTEPENPRLWLDYGRALHAKGRLEEALEAHLKAAGFEETKLRGMYNAACANALLGKTDEAFRWLERLKATKRFDLTDIGLESDLTGLEKDPRFERLFPSPEDYADPFVEPAKVIQEWKGETEGDAFGWIARNIGDVDGDGVNDVTTSAPNKNVDGPFAGRVYVYSGKTGKFLWSVSGEPGDRLGLGIEAAGDVNADGVPDVVAGAPGGGKVYVYSGRDGAVLLTMLERHEGEILGRKVSDVGDVNGDGHDDVFVGAPGNDERGEDAGRASVYSGKDGEVLLTWYGEEPGDRFGASGDGAVRGKHLLYVVGAPDAGEGDRGRVYVYEASDGRKAFVIEPDEKDAELGGMFVSVVGDVNADGVPDVYGSDWSSNANGEGSGRIYVHSGASGERLLTLDGEAAGDGFGIGPADAGDVNGDGHDDLVVGAWQHGGAAPSGGKVYLFSGKDGTLMRAWTGKVPGETFGFDATGMGDVDGDGEIDFLVTSAWSAIHGSRSGRMFLLSGR